MADYPESRTGVQTGTPNARPATTPGLNAGMPPGGTEPRRELPAQRSGLGPAIAAAAVVIVVGLVAWNVLGDRDTQVTPAPVNETTAPDTTATTPDTPGTVTPPTPPEVVPEPTPAPVPDTTPGIVPEGDPPADLPPVGDPPAAPQTGTGTTTP